MSNLNIHERLKEARVELNLNQSEIAKDLNIQQKSISEIENGKIINIPNKYIYYFYKKGISLIWIYDNVGEMVFSSNKKDIVSDKMELNADFNELNLDNIKSIKNEKGNNLHERIIESKDFSIEILLNYIKLQEENIKLLKQKIA